MVKDWRRQCICVTVGLRLIYIREETLYPCKNTTPSPPQLCRTHPIRKFVRRAMRVVSRHVRIQLISTLLRHHSRQLSRPSLLVDPTSQLPHIQQRDSQGDESRQQRHAQHRNTGNHPIMLVPTAAAAVGLCRFRPCCRLRRHRGRCRTPQRGWHLADDVAHTVFQLEPQDFGVAAAIAADCTAPCGRVAGPDVRVGGTLPVVVCDGRKLSAYFLPESSPKEGSPTFAVARAVGALERLVGASIHPEQVPNGIVLRR